MKIKNCNVLQVMIVVNAKRKVKIKLININGYFISKALIISKAKKSKKAISIISKAVVMAVSKAKSTKNGTKNSKSIFVLFVI